MSTGTMKAIQVHTYGGPEVLTYEDVPRPIAGPGEVLLRVYAAGVNPSDLKQRTGFADFPEDRRPPRQSLPLILGLDISGIVEAVGPEVTSIHPGDAVYGMTRLPEGLMGGSGTYGGSYAEYTTTLATNLAPKPATIDHLHAAALPTAALTAWQALFEYGRLEAGQSVLVNGAAGGVGHLAVQLAKASGARVIGVASGRHEAFLHDIGVDQFIDYTTTPLEQVAHDVDLVLDAVGAENGDRLLDVLKRGGRLVPIFLGKYSAERAAEASVTISLCWMHTDAAQLVEIGKLIDAGRVRVAIEMVVPLWEACRAHERAESQHLRGKIVLSVI
ncbi:MAG TPA: NADP-dependent oxidoreductase [Ktedonosporobacter sp.]|nr:NADP-dependent oxidoreductase [Ktedonosporobacter sp.]